MIYRIDKDKKPVPVSNPTFTNSSANVPVGFMMMYAGTAIPDGFMAAMGQSLERARYKKLFEIIGTKFGAADDEHFNLPDTREAAIVGAGINDKSTADAYDEGEFKEHQFASHTHAQASHSHSGVSHSHTLNHCHTLTPHTHTNGCAETTTAVCSCTYRGCCAGVWTGQSQDYTGVSTPGPISSLNGNVCAAGATTVAVCSATATTCAGGASSGGTHGKRMGVYYIIKVEADR